MLQREIIILMSLLGLCWLPSQGQEKAPIIIIEDAQSGKKLESVSAIFYQDGTSVDGAYSDQRGQIYLERYASWDSIQFRFVGYRTYTSSKINLAAQNYLVRLHEDMLQLDEVIVSGLKVESSLKSVAAGVAVVRAETIEFQNPQTAADLLMQSGKVFVQKSQMGGGSPNLRGFEANRVMIVIDGIRMNNAIYRGGHLQNVITIDPNLIDRTEVLFGPSSVQYGSDALGGVMHFISKQPQISRNKDISTKLNVFSRYASVNQEKTGHFDFNIGGKKWASLSSVTVSDFGDLRTGANRPEGQVDQNGLTFGTRPEYADRINGVDTILQNENINVQRFSGYRQYDFLQKLIFIPNKKVKHDFNIQYSTSSDVPRYDRLTERRDGQLRRSEWFYGPQERFLGAYTLNLFSSRFYDKLNLILSYQNIGESRHTRNVGSDWRNNRMERVQVAALNLDANKNIGNHRLLYGLEATYNDVQSEAFRTNILTLETGPLDTRYPDGGSSMQFLAAYIGDQWSHQEKLFVNTGIRYTFVHLLSRFEDKSFFPFLQDSIERYTGALSANLGIVYNADNGWRLAFSASTGFRSPNVDDVGKAFDSEPGTVIVPNPELTPEYTYNTELSISKQLADRFRVEVVGWFTWYDNAIEVRDFSFGGQNFIEYEGVMSRVQANQNTDQAILTGTNVNLLWQLADAWQFTATATYTYGQVITDDIPLSHIPPFFGRSSFKYRKGKWQVEAYSLFNGAKTLERYSPSGEDNFQFATPEGMPAWYTLNLKAAFQAGKNARLQLGMENILDRHYRHFASGVSAPGRNLIATLRLNL